MMDITEFDKDQLAEYAKNVFSVDLNMRKSLDKLRAEVIVLQTKPEPEAAPANPAATHILNKDNGRVFPWSEHLQKYLKNTAGCDENGNIV